MKYIKTFENLNDEPKNGEYLILEINNANKIKTIAKITSNSRDSIAHKYSKVFNTYDILGDYDSDIYYNYKDNFYFYASGIRCYILFKSFDKNEILNIFEMMNNINKYNL